MRTILIAVVISVLSACATVKSVDDEFPDSLWNFEKKAEPVAKVELEDCSKLGSMEKPVLEWVLCSSRNDVRKEMQGKLEAAEKKLADAESDQNPAPRPPLMTGFVSTGIDRVATTERPNDGTPAMGFWGLHSVEVYGTPTPVHAVCAAHNERLLSVSGPGAIRILADLGNGQPEMITCVRSQSPLYVLGVQPEARVRLYFLQRDTARVFAAGGANYPVYSLIREKLYFHRIAPGLHEVNAREGI